MTKKKNNNPFLTLAIVATVITVIVAVLSWDLILYSFNDPVDLYSTEFDIIKHGTGGRIETNLYASLGNCAYETTTTEKYGVTTSESTDYFYAIPVFDSNDEEYYICVKVDSKQSAKYEQMVDYTYKFFETGEYEYLDKSNIPFEGTIKKLDDEIHGYMIECFEEIDYYETEAELNKYVLPYCLEPMDFSTAPVFMIILIIALLLSVLFWILFFKRNAKIKAELETARNQFEAMNPGQNFGDYVVLNGVSYPKAAFNGVNAFVGTGEKIQAISELRNITGLDLETSKNIIDNWQQYYF